MKKSLFAILCIICLLGWVSCEPIVLSGEHHQEEEQTGGEGGDKADEEDDTGKEDDKGDKEEEEDDEEDKDEEPVEYTVSLTYGELQAAEGGASAYVAGYKAPRNYTNEAGTWAICAYNYSSAIQINSGHVAYLGTPEFEGMVTEVTIQSNGSYKDDIYLCSDAGNNEATGILGTYKGGGTSTFIDCSALKASSFFIRSSGCLRITSVEIKYVTGGESSTGGGKDGDEDDEQEEEGDEEEEDDSGGFTGGSSGAYKWFELPVINDSDHNGVDDIDKTLYYANHLCAGGEKGPGGKTARNYTVCYSGEYHCPVWVAAPRHNMYEGSSGRSSYSHDPDIPYDIQYKNKETGGNCNKGHMLGSAERTCSAATNKQVFYYTNIAPQLSSGFNTGGGGWNILEDWVDDQVCPDTLYVVIGAYFKSFTDGYGNTVAPKTIDFGGRSDVAFPTMFYYILLRTKSGYSHKPLSECTSSELKCAVFARAHTNALKGQRPSSKEMMSVSELEKITGFTYFPNVPQAPKNSFKASDWGL